MYENYGRERRRQLPMQMRNINSFVKGRIAKATPLRAGLLIAFATFIFPSVVFNIQPHGWIDWYRLATLGQQTQGKITRKQPEIHQTCYFEYQTCYFECIVNSIPYEGADQGCHSDVGQFVVVKYLPKDPSFATTSSPIEQLTLMVLGPFALCVFGGAGAARSVSRRQRPSDL